MQVEEENAVTTGGSVAEESESTSRRLVRAISEANQLLIRERYAPTLLQSFCRLVVEEAGFRMAWIGIADEEALRVRPAAVAGIDDGYVEGLDIRLDDSPHGRGPTALAIKERRPAIVQEYESDARTAPWRGAARERGYRASAVFPLFHGGAAWGALSVYAASAHAFDGEVATLLEDLSGNLARTLEMVSAERARAEAVERLRESEDMFRYVFDHSPIPKSISEPAGPMRVNQAFCDLLGYSQQELATIGWPGVTHPDDLELSRRVVESLLSGLQEQARFTKRYLHRNGSVVWADVSTVARRDSAGKTPYFLTVVNDITEAKRMEEEREAAALYARSLIEASLDPLVTISPDGKITDVNAATEDVTGSSREELIGTDFSDYFTDPGSARDGYRRVFDTGSVRDYPLTIRRKTGRLTDVLYNATVYRDPRGRVRGVFAAARDVTEQNRAEARIQAAMAELERSNRELEQFAYVASHDLQEPLRMISSYTQLLAQRYGERLDADARDFIGFAVDGANRMQRLINDLLLYSRVGTRGRPLQPVDSHAALGRALLNLRALVDETGALVTSDELPEVLADEGQLVQLLQNLVGNAVKFHRPDEPPRVHVSASAEVNDWHFSVRDNGIGIAPEFHRRLFVIFQRLHGRDAYPGTGIGLAVCKRIVERHGGRIWVESEPDRGSTFHFTLHSPRLEEALHAD